MGAQAYLLTSLGKTSDPPGLIFNIYILYKLEVQGGGVVKASIFSHDRVAYKSRKSISTKIASEIKQSCFNLPAGAFIEVVPREWRVMKNTAVPE